MPGGVFGQPGWTIGSGLRSHRSGRSLERPHACYRGELSGSRDRGRSSAARLERQVQCALERRQSREREVASVHRCRHQTRSRLDRAGIARGAEFRCRAAVVFTAAGSSQLRRARFDAGDLLRAGSDLSAEGCLRSGSRRWRRPMANTCSFDATSTMPWEDTVRWREPFWKTLSWPNG